MINDNEIVIFGIDKNSNYDNTIGFIIHQLGVELPDADFGFNPTTPKKVEAC